MVDDDTHGGAVAQEQPAAYLTPKDIQRELRIGERLAYKLLKDGTIPSVRVGGLYRIPRSRLDEALGVRPGLGRQA